ncbi:hypothetical protein D3C71_1697770 [compost metagenome]
MEASRVSVTEVLRDSTSTSPDCSAVKRCCETSGTHLTLLASPSSAAAIALPTSTSRPVHCPLLSAAEKPGTPLLMPMLIWSRCLMVSMVLPACAEVIPARARASREKREIFMGAPVK